MVVARASARRADAPLRAAEKHKRSPHGKRQADALMQALGEFAVFTAQLKRSQQKKKRRATHLSASTSAQQHASAAGEKRTVIEWLRTLSAAECSSLCTIVDAGFVKTLLSMAMISKQKRQATVASVSIGSGVDEFQLLPMALKSTELLTADAKKLLKNDGAVPSSLPLSTAPREFIRRPRVRTADGDVIGGFHAPAYSECCAMLLPFIRILNTNKSCDTVTLTMELFGGKQQLSAMNRPISHTKHTDRNALFLYMMEHISDGHFLAACPSESALRSKIWGETKWLAARGYYSLQALLVNQIEMNIWRHWIEKKKASGSLIYKVPLMGLGAKMYLAEEWVAVQGQQQTNIVKRLCVPMMEHLRAMKPKLAQASNAQGMNSSLASLMDIIASLQAGASQGKAEGVVHVFTDCCFSCSMEETLKAPQAAIVKLLVAEQLQEQCSVLLSERLSHEQDTMLAADEVENGESKSANHTQRRRANRKKLLKKRRHEAEVRATQQTLLKATLEELKSVVRRKKDLAVKSVSEIVDDIVEHEVVEAKPKVNRPPSMHTLVGIMDALVGASKKKKKKKKAKKTDDMNVTTTAADVPENKVACTSTQLVISPLPPKSKRGLRSTTTALNQEERNCQSSSTQLVMTPETRPLLSFFDKSYTSPLSMPTFGPDPLYETTPSPFFLSLASQELDPRSNGGPNEAEEDKTSHKAGSGRPDRDTSESSYEWYLPSLFSSEASNHTNSTTSSLDWDFNNWQLKNETPVTPKTAPISGGIVSRASRNGSQATLTSGKPYSLESFSSMLGIDNGRRNESSSPEDTAAGENASSAEDCRDASGSLSVKSDFLYQQGGFFDRQRSLKRRRRPLPFDYEHDEDDEHRDDSGCDDTWDKCRHCCGCRCHRDEEDRECKCKEKDLAETANEMPLSGDDATVQRDNSAVSNRLAKLEIALEEHSRRFDDVSSTYMKEVAGLKQTVSSLNVQLMTVEAELRELKLAQENNSANSPVVGRDMNENGSPSVVGNAANTNASLLPFPPAQTAAMVNQQNASQHDASPNEYMYANQMVAPVDASASILGPFVSVPMSVLPPRTKLHWDICEFISQLQTDSNNRLPAQMAALRLCTATVQSLWPRAQVRPYGSFVTRLVLPSSDIDLVICLPKVRRDAPADAAGVLEGRNAIKETWQQNLARKLRQEPWVIPDSVKTIPHAAIPIITLITAAPYNVRLDISFEGPGHNGLETNDVVLSLIHEFPPLAPIMLVLKSFAIERGFAISYSGGLSSYSLLLMVARYLQEHSDTVTNGFENVSAAVQHSISSQSCADFGMMLMGFLDFYGNRFDPRTTGISVASRCFLNRENMFLSASARDHHQYAADDAVLDDRNAHLHSGHWQMPQQSPVNQHSGNLLSSPGSRRYGNRSSMDWPQATHMADVTHDPHKFDPVFIEDPLRPSNNVGRNLFRIMQIRRAFSAAYSTLMAASVSPSVFNENRTTKITGVALHPDNMLRAILGVNAPVKAKSEATNSSAASAGNGAGHGMSPTNANHVGYPAAVGSGGVGFPYLNYSHTGVAASSGQYFGGDANHGAQPYPFYSHYQHQHQQQHYLQAQQQRAYVVAGGSHGVRNDSSSYYRRHSESVTEKMTTRSEMAASEKYQKNDRRKDRLVSPRLVQNHHATAAQRSMDDTDEDQVKTRKGPARSLSFADVVVGGNTYSASTMEYHRKEPPSSPLALVRPSRFWRDDSTIEDSISEKWESKDDSELK